MAEMPLEDEGMCFCCGPRNPIGLHLEFEMTPERRMRTVWTPREEHQGFKDIVHGGLVATVLDEVMIRLLYELDIHAVTGSMETKLHRPLRWGRRYRFEAWVVQERGRAIHTEAEARDLESGEKVARGKATCIKVR